MFRVYGYEIGEGSRTQVTRGMLRATKAVGLFSGFVPMDHLNEYATYDGSDAPISLNFGVPLATYYAHRMGHHQQNWLLIAPNGETLPAKMAATLMEETEVAPRGLVDGLLAPSKWAVTVLCRAFPGRPVRLAPHGVTPTVHRVRQDLRAGAHERYGRGGFDVIHLTSTSLGRKGTRELLRAWKRLLAAGDLPKASQLRVISDPHAMSDLQWFAADEVVPQVTFALGLGHTQDWMAEQYSMHHLICQPSRGEGFGMVPLEALACGVPICATRCTGHGEWFKPMLPGAFTVESGPNAALDEFEGAVAPEVTVAAVQNALATAYVGWREAAEAAEENASALAEAWSWEAKNEGVLRLLATEATK